jgi:type I restriction enzyme S subunit
LEIAFPNVQEQKAIVKILSDIEEKIEANNQINKKLEGIAKAIFKTMVRGF